MQDAVDRIRKRIGAVRGTPKGRKRRSARLVSPKLTSPRPSLGKQARS